MISPEAVTAGQLIAEMDKVTLESDLEEAEAQLVSDAEYDESLYLYETAKNTYAQHQASIVGIRRNLGYATITSPIDGVVISRAVEEGQTVAAGFETPTLFTIANDVTDMQVIADVDEADIGYVQEGQRVDFTVDAYPDDVFSGTVEQVRLEATTESSVVTYEVVITAYSQCHDIHYGTQRCMLCPLQGFAFRAGCRLGIRRFAVRQDGLPAAPYRAGRYTVCRGVEGLCTDKVLEEQLPADRFIRVHRSYIIQPSKMSYIERGRVVFGKVRIPVSDTYRQGLHDFLGRHSVFL